MGSWVPCLPRVESPKLLGRHRRLIALSVRSELHEIRAETGEMFLARGTQVGRYQESLRLIPRYVTGRTVSSEPLSMRLCKAFPLRRIT